MFVCNGADVNKDKPAEVPVVWKCIQSSWCWLSKDVKTVLIKNVKPKGNFSIFRYIQIHKHHCTTAQISLLTVSHSNVLYKLVTETVAAVDPHAVTSTFLEYTL